MICDYVDVSDEDDVNFDELSKRFWQLDVLLDDQDKEARIYSEPIGAKF